MDHLKEEKPRDGCEGSGLAGSFQTLSLFFTEKNTELKRSTMRKPDKKCQREVETEELVNSTK